MIFQLNILIIILLCVIYTTLIDKSRSLPFYLIAHIWSYFLFLYWIKHFSIAFIPAFSFVFSIVNIFILIILYIILILVLKFIFIYNIIFFIAWKAIVITHVFPFHRLLNNVHNLLFIWFYFILKFCLY